MMPSVDMIKEYAPNVSPQTIAAIVRVESGGNQYAIGINGPVKRRTRPKSVSEAVAEARYWISKGYSVDLGLMQINSRNLPGLGLTLEQAFHPGINIQAGAKILLRGYRGAIKQFGPGQDALRATLSAYNTGNYRQGFRNGYVAKYFPEARIKHGINLVLVKEERATDSSVSTSNNYSLSISGSVKRYNADLTVFRNQSPKIMPVQDFSESRMSHNILSIARLVTDLAIDENDLVN